MALTRVVPGETPGIRRVRSGSGFRYVDAGNTPVEEADRERIRDLAIPPAWKDVWIAADPLAHIQAVGTDDAGRRQYLYHPLWRTGRDQRKFARALKLAAALPAARAKVTRAIGEPGLTRERALAVSFRLLDDAALRIGSERYLVKHGSRGLSTLRRRDVRIDGSTVSLSFPAKSKQLASIEITDAPLAEALSEFAVGSPRAPLLAYRKGRRRVRLNSSEVNDYLRKVAGAAFTAKDFRTLHGQALGTRQHPRCRAGELYRSARVPVVLARSHARSHGLARDGDPQAPRTVTAISSLAGRCRSPRPWRRRACPCRCTAP
jgi:DNA topoisomerase-1